MAYLNNRIDRIVPPLHGEKYENVKKRFGKIKKGHEIAIQEVSSKTGGDFYANHVRWGIVTNTREKNGKLEIQLFMFSDTQKPLEEDRWYRVGMQQNALVSYKPTFKTFRFCWYSVDGFVRSSKEIPSNTRESNHGGKDDRRD